MPPRIEDSKLVASSNRGRVKRSLGSQAGKKDFLCSSAKSLLVFFPRLVAAKPRQVRLHVRSFWRSVSTKILLLFSGRWGRF